MPGLQVALQLGVEEYLEPAAERPALLPVAWKPPDAGSLEDKVDVLARSDLDPARRYRYDLAFVPRHVQRGDHQGQPDLLLLVLLVNALALAILFRFFGGFVVVLIAGCAWLR